MNFFFLLFFSLTVSGTLLAAILFLFKPFYQNKLRKSWQYYIWLIVLLRFFIPFSLPGNMVHKLFSPSIIRNETFSSQNFFIESNSYFSKQPSSDKTESTLEKNTFGWKAMKENLWLFWLAIAILLLVRKITSYFNFLHFIRVGSLPITNFDILEQYQQCCTEMKVKRKILLFRNKLAVSPMLAGFLHPCIILPQTTYSSKELSYIFKHELTHYQRHDLIYKWFAQIVVCLHWYNPVVYFIRKEINKNCELSCDEAIIQKLNQNEKKQYGDMLLSSLQDSGSYMDHIVSITLNENGRLLKERLEAIMKYTENTKMKKTVSFLLMIVLSFGAAKLGCVTLASEKTKESTVFPDDKEINAVNFQEKKEDGENFSFHTDYFYENSYIIGISWNVSPAQYPNKLTLSLSNKEYPISFSEETKKYMETKEIQNGILKFIAEKQAKKLEFPLIIEVSGPYQDSSDTLLQRFYEEDNLVYFSAVVPKAGEDVIRSLAEKAFKEDEITYFSILSPSLSQQEKETLAFKAFEKDDIAFFNILSSSLSSDSQKKLAYQTFENDNIGLFHSLSSSLSPQEKEALAFKALNQDKVAFFNGLSSSFSSEKQRELAYQAYEKDNIAVFGSLIPSLSQEDKDALAEKSFQDDRIAFFGSLSSFLSSEKKKELAYQAYEKDNIAVFGSLMSYLTPQEKEKLREKAYKENKIAFLSALSY